MQAQTAVVLGATGFIGKHLVDELKNDSAFSKVRLLVRRPVNYNDPKIEEVVTDFSNPDDFKTRLGNGDALFCCIGTTMKQVNGDKDAYRKIDFDIPVNAAKFAKQAGFSQYLLVSSVGAGKDAGNFYLQLKGEVEDAIKDLGINSFHVFRPSMLMGERKEFRLGEWLGKGLMKVVSPLLLGKYKKYRGISGDAVAKAMVRAANSNKTGTFYYEYEKIKNPQAIK